MPTEIYTKPDCIYCTKAKALLDKMGIEYDSYMLNVDFTREELLMRFPNAKTFPQIILNDEYIGGYDALAEKLLG